ncbi:hypothetical protein F53441_4224 [Fusarium austroafricanum]|uniref:Uncharacterized protein n=1 Tax=Fusarium austroafricanum TaxID=2364996 RepID=A0A8H4KNN8_9HYPO|nr:hypothetical protein F53441_4224 [Fusarium austroafricanum]
MSWNYRGQADNRARYSGRLEEYVRDPRVDWTDHSTSPRNANQVSPFAPVRRAAAHLPERAQGLEDLAAENAELRRVAADSEQLISELRSQRDEVSKRHNKHIDHLCELQSENKHLKSQVSDLRAQLSYATDTLTTKFQEQTNATKLEDDAIQKYKKQITDQSRVIAKLKHEKDAAVNTVNQLRKKEKGNPSKAPKKCKKPEKGPSANVTMSSPALADSFSPVLPSAIKTPSELAEEFMALRLIPGRHLTAEVKAQFSEVPTRNLDEFTNLHSFLFCAKQGEYYCFHEVCEKGEFASIRLIPTHSGCQVQGPRCKFMVKVVASGYCERKLQAYNPARVDEPQYREDSL